jgi:hypothetical protein
MRLPSAAIILLLLLLVSLAGGNLWFTAARSTIPLSLNATVLDMELKREKHDGVDDVHLLRLNDQRTIVVDERVFEAIETQRHISKAAGDRELLVDGIPTPLDWSDDYCGMRIVMPTAVGFGCLLMIAAVWYRAARGEA